MVIAKQLSSWGKDELENWIKVLPISNETREDLLKILDKDNKREKLLEFIVHKKKEDIEVFLGHNFISSEDINIIANAIIEIRKLQYGQKASLDNQINTFNQLLKQCYVPDIKEWVIKIEELAQELTSKEKKYLRYQEQKFQYKEISADVGKKLDELLLNEQEKKKIIRSLEENPKIFVVGDKNTGKSLLINMLLREKDAVIAKDGPCTNVITELRYCESKEEEKVLLLDKERNVIKKIDLKEIEKYTTKNHSNTTITHQTSTTNTDGRINRSNTGHCFVEMYLHKPMLQFLTIVDTPGLSDDEDLTNIVFEHLKHADMIFFLVGLDGLGNDLKKILGKQNLNGATKEKIIFIVNKFDMLKKKEIENKMKMIENEFSNFEVKKINVVDEENMKKRRMQMLEKEFGESDKTRSSKVDLKPVEKISEHKKDNFQIHYVSVKNAYDAWTSDFLPIPETFSFLESTIFECTERTYKKRGIEIWDTLMQQLGRLQNYILSGEKGKKDISSEFRTETLAKLENIKKDINTSLTNLEIESERIIEKTTQYLEIELSKFWDRIANILKFKSTILQEIETILQERINEAITEINNSKDSIKIKEYLDSLDSIHKELLHKDVKISIDDEDNVVTYSGYAAGVGAAGYGLGLFGLLLGAPTIGLIGIASTTAAVATGGVILAIAAPIGLFGAVVFGVGSITHVISKFKWDLQQSRNIGSSLEKVSDKLKEYIQDVKKRVWDYSSNAEMNIKQILSNSRSTEEFSKTYAHTKEKLKDLQKELLEYSKTIKP